MTAKIISGREVAENILQDLKKRVDILKKKNIIPKKNCDKVTKIKNWY